MNRKARFGSGSIRIHYMRLALPSFRLPKLPGRRGPIDLEPIKSCARNTETENVSSRVIPRQLSNCSQGDLSLTPKGGWHIVLRKGRLKIAEGTQMKIKLSVAFIGTAVLLLIAGPVFAHHG